jgi:N utilization substance protein B
MSKYNPQARRTARHFAVQAIYEWQISQNAPSVIEAHMLLQAQGKKIDFAYFKKLLHGVVDHCTELDELLTPYMSRKISETNPVELAILRIACYELKHCIDVPYRAVINEALELAKTFGAEESHRFVNGVLDQLAKHLRKLEMS